MSRMALKNAPTNMGVFTLIFKKEISNISEIFTSSLYSLLYYLLVIVIFNISIGANELNESTSIGIHFSAITLAILLSSKRLFIDDIKSGFLDQLKLTGVDQMVIYSAKSVANCLLVTFFYSFIFPIGILILNINDEIVSFYASSMIYTISASFIIFLLSLLGADANRADFLLPLLGLPFLIPLVIISIVGISTLNFFLLSVSLMMFFMFFCSYLGGKLI